MLKQIASIDSASWAEAQTEIFIFKEDDKYENGSKRISVLKEL